MRFFGFELNQALPVPVKTQDAPARSESSRASGHIKTVSLRVGDKGLDYNGVSSRAEKLLFDPPEYDLGKIARAIDTDAYIRRALTRYQKSIFRRGWSLTGKNPNAVSYIRTRLRQMEDVTSQPTELFFDELTQQLVWYHNCFIAKVRSEKASGGRIWTDFDGKERIPIAGYFVQDATTMEICRLQRGGAILNYRQNMKGVLEGELPTWKPDDMIHLFMDRKVGLSFGCPMVVPVLADVLALRRIEENIEILVFQYAIPFIQYKIGFPNTMEYDPNEIDKVEQDIRNMQTEGMFVTPPHHEIKAVGVEGRAIRAEGYLKYFKQRVFSGLGTSAIGMGEGDMAKATANRLTQSEIEVAEQYVKAVIDGVSFYMFRELLKEGGFDTRDEENLVYLHIPPIDLDQAQAIANHAKDQFMSGAIDEDEMRMTIGREPFKPEQRSKTFFELNKLPLTMVQAVDEPFIASVADLPHLSPEMRAIFQKSAKVAETIRQAGLGASTVGGQGAKPNPSTPSAQQKTARNQNQPTNQHGTKPSKGTPINDSEEGDGNSVDSGVADHSPDSPHYTEELGHHHHHDGVSSLMERMNTEYDLTASDTQEYIHDAFLRDNRSPSDLSDAVKDFRANRLKLTFQITTDQIQRHYQDHARHAYTEGMKDIADQAGVEHFQVLDRGEDVVRIAQMASQDITSIMEDVTTRIVRVVRSAAKAEDLLPAVRGVFDANRYRLDFFSRSHLRRAFVLGQLHAADALGYEDVEIRPLGREDNACSKPQMVRVKDLNPRTIPPYHANCTQVLRLAGGKKGT